MLSHMPPRRVAKLRGAGVGLNLIGIEPEAKGRALNLWKLTAIYA